MSFILVTCHINDTVLPYPRSQEGGKHGMGLVPRGAPGRRAAPLVTCLFSHRVPVYPRTLAAPPPWPGHSFFECLLKVLPVCPYTLPGVTLVPFIKQRGAGCRSNALPGRVSSTSVYICRCCLHDSESGLHTCRCMWCTLGCPGVAAQLEIESKV